LSILSEFEDRIGRALEGGFANMFRAPVQPAELARKLGREMDRGKKLGVGKIYAPILYTVLLSRQDDAALGGFADTLAGELETYLLSYAREHNYELATRPVVRFLVDRELKLGRFEVIGELISPEEMAAELGYHPDDEEFETPRAPSSVGAPLSGAPLSATPVPSAPAPAAESVPTPGGVFDADDLGLDFGAPANPSAETATAHAAASPTEVITPAASLATVTVRGVDHDVVLRGDRSVIGRLSSCDICLSDANASREHAAFEREGNGWAIRDLGSTNGTIVNGQRVPRQRLKDGDLIVIGVTELVYHEPRD
jgi:FhaA, N-terminal domain/FHA domain